MSATATPPLPVTRGAASVIFQIASAARQDPDALRELAMSMLDTWQALDLETLHPTQPRDPLHEYL